MVSDYDLFCDKNKDIEFNPDGKDYLAYKQQNLQKDMMINSMKPNLLMMMSMIFK
jgi:hypothetical protein